MDDFAIKYTTLDNAQHLLHAMKQKYTISEDWEAKLYIGISLKWDSSKQTVDLSMPGYVTATLQRLRHQLKNTRQPSPHHHFPPTYGARVQFAESEDNTPLLTEEKIKFIQQVVGVFLYYAIAIDNTVIVPLSDIGSEQARATSKTMDKVQQLLDCLASDPNETIRYHARGMIIFIHIDASYLSVTKTRSRANGVFSLSDPKPDAITFSGYTPILNGLIFIMCKSLRNIMASTSDAEYGALFLNGQAAVPIRTTLIECIIPSHPPRYKWTIPPQWEFPTRASNKNAPRLWICVFIGYRIELSRNTLMFFGNQDPLI